jgi:hypothetical protein
MASEVISVEYQIGKVWKVFFFLYLFFFVVEVVRVTFLVVI